MKFIKLKKIQLRVILFGLREEKVLDSQMISHRLMKQVSKSMREDTSEKFDIHVIFNHL